MNPLPAGNIDIVDSVDITDTVQVCDSRTHCGDNSDEARCEAVFLHTKYHPILLTSAN